MIINHVFIGPGPVKASDLFNILTWVSIGATVNIYVANPTKELDAEQHTYESLFNLKQDMGNNASMRYDVGTNLFSMYKIVGSRSVGVADRVKLINLPVILDGHDQLVPDALRDQTSGWKTGILKFLTAARGQDGWWPNMEKVFTAVDATKFYLSATRQGLTCDMKVAPTRYFKDHEAKIATMFISFQRGSAGAAGYENQCSGSMSDELDKTRVPYANSGRIFGNAFGQKTVEAARRSFEGITAEHGKAMQKLAKDGRGIDSTKLPNAKPVADPESGWKGPLCVWKHPRDQSWAGRTLTEDQKVRAVRDINDMTKEALKLVSGTESPLQEEILDAMGRIAKFPGFNIYA